MSVLYPQNFVPPQSSRVRFLIIHHTAEDSASSLSTLTRPNGAVSVHYLVDVDGKIYSLVPETQKAWHAGVSSWGKYYDLNVSSIGIEIVNLDGNKYPYPPEQIASVKELCLDIMKRHGIAQHHVLGHSDITPSRKIDPGFLFPWKDFSLLGIGMWQDENLDLNITTDNLQSSVMQNLVTIGYEMTDFNATLTAFRRHFNASDIQNSEVTKKDYAITQSLIKKWYS